MSGDWMCAPGGSCPFCNDTEDASPEDDLIVHVTDEEGVVMLQLIEEVLDEHSELLDKLGDA